MTPFRIAGLFALAAAPVLFSIAPSHAACVESVGMNTCAAFDPTSVTSVTSAGGFVTTNLNPFSPYTRARLLFVVNGSWSLPVSISSISLTGEGITGGPLSFGSITINNNLTPVVTSYLDLPSPVSSLNFANNKISFTIPANVANIPVNGNPYDWSSISAFVTYGNLDPMMPDTNTSSRIQFTARNPAPTPLPLMGAASAFAFSRRLRRRVSQSA